MLELTDSDVYQKYPYDIDAIGQSIHQILSRAQVDDQVDVVCKCVRADFKLTSDKGEPYMLFSGVDSNRNVVGPIYMWRHVEQDFSSGHIYMIRGLRAAAEKQWSDEAGRYVPSTDGSKALSVGRMTAVEDVTSISAIKALFDGREW